MENRNENAIDLATRRVGSAHEEQVIGDRSICGTCGWIDEADETSIVVRAWHADSFAQEMALES